MTYRVLYSESAIKALKKTDKHQAKMLLAWVEKHLVGCENPRLHGKPLGYNYSGAWRYRIGVYRLIADIQDDTVTIEIINIGHRKHVYTL